MLTLLLNRGCLSVFSYGTSLTLVSEDSADVTEGPSLRSLCLHADFTTHRLTALKSKHRWTATEEASVSHRPSPYSLSHTHTLVWWLRGGFFSLWSHKVLSANTFSALTVIDSLFWCLIDSVTALVDTWQSSNKPSGDTRDSFMRWNDHNTHTDRSTQKYIFTQTCTNTQPVIIHTLAFLVCADEMTADFRLAGLRREQSKQKNEKDLKGFIL